MLLRRSHSLPLARPFHHSRPLSSSNGIGFAFDIDGVLLRSSQPVGGSPEAVRQLQSAQVPFIFLTNGGGKSERARINDLRDKLQVPTLEEESIVQSHTPFRGLSHLHDKNVLVVGGDGDKCRAVAQSYGFQSVILPSDIYAQQPSIWPFSSNFSHYHATFAKPLPADPLQISAILVFNDPRDFGLDLTLTVDLLLSAQGRLGTLSAKNGNPTLPNHGYQSDGQPELYFSNPDLWWAASYPLSRLGQGAFRAALEGVWAEITNHSAQLRHTVIGKPYQMTYEFAERQLRANSEKMKCLPPRRVYMIGDNPASDIAGANGYKSPWGTEWISVLVGTGVWRGGKPAHEPKRIAKDVFDAVQWALQNG